jgi:hypothetical protein
MAVFYVVAPCGLVEVYPDFSVVLAASIIRALADVVQLTYTKRDLRISRQ